MKVKREMDGAYFRVERDGHWESICFSDLEVDEQREVLKGRTAEWLKGLCMYLGSQLRFVGDQLDVELHDEDD